MANQFLKTLLGGRTCIWKMLLNIGLFLLSKFPDIQPFWDQKVIEGEVFSYIEERNGGRGQKSKEGSEKLELEGSK